MKKNIKLSDLQINTENYRFEPLENQEEAIDHMIENQGIKLLNLAKDITQKGFNPHEDIIVYLLPYQKNKYNVLEGNRRIIALKLLQNPSLIRGQENSSLKKKFKKLNEQFKLRIIKDARCFVYKDPKEAERWIGLKHGYGASGIGTENWNPLQKNRFQEKTEGKSSVTIQIIKKMESSVYVSEDVKQRLNHLKISNLQRLISDPEIRNFLGIEVEEGILKSKLKEEEVMKGLIQIVKNLLEPGFKVKDIYTKEDREGYLKKFPKNSRPNKNNITKFWKFVKKTSKISKKRGVRPLPKDRKFLIPKTCDLRISNSRINHIYYELQTINIEKFTNATAVLLRVFVELSIDRYIEEYGLTKSAKDLQQKVLLVASHLKNKKWADKNICKGIKVSVKDKNSILGIDTWHAYIHNHEFSPAPRDLNRTWDNMQKFIEKVWEKIK